MFYVSTQFLENLWSLLMIAALAGFIAYILFAIVIRKFRIPEHRTGLLYLNGKFIRPLGPGTYWILRPNRTASLKLYDTRRTIFTVSGQDLLSSDNVGLKVSLSVSYEIDDPYLADTSVTDYIEALYTSAQLALRSAVGKREIENILDSRDEIGREILECVARDVEFAGLKVHYAEVKDVMFPGELKRIFSEVVKARKEAQAMLKRARGETAALRKLANLGSILKSNPELLKLKVVQAMADQSIGNTFVMGVPKDMTPIDV